MSLKLFFILVVLILGLSSVMSGPAVKSNYIEQENSCREVCGLCDCDGFYCEDECICECSIKDEDNLQCIADMKTECDKNGLEYELLMQEDTKERFLRQIKPNMMPFDKLSKNLVIIKKKREDAPVEEELHEEEKHKDPIVAAPAPADSTPSLFSNVKLDFKSFDFPTSNFQLGAAPSKIEFPNLEGFEPKKLMMSIRDNFQPSHPTTTTPKPLPPLPSLSLPRLQSPSFSLSSISIPAHNIPSIDWNRDLILQPPGTY